MTTPHDIWWAERNHNRNGLMAACRKVRATTPEQRDWLYWALRALGSRRCYWPFIEYCICMAFHEHKEN